MIDYERGQGATEYLLMLAAVLVVVASAVYFMMGSGPSFMVHGACRTDPDDNATVVFTVDTITPEKVTSADLKVVSGGGANLGENNNVTLKSGTIATVDCGGNDAIGATLNVTAKGSTKSFPVQEG